MARQRGSQFSSTVGSTTVIGNSSGGGTTQMTIQDEGVNISTVVDTINFIGADVRALAGGSSNIVLVYTQNYCNVWRIFANRQGGESSLLDRLYAV